MSKQVKEYMDSVDKLRDYKESDLAIIIKKYEKEFEHKLDKDKVHFIRCDGRAFKTFCKGFEKPFDKIFRDTMEKTMVALCEELQGSIMGFTQSDEITIMFKKQNDDSQLPFRGRVQKICSLMASQTTLKFNEIFINEVTKAKFKLMEEYEKNSNLSYYEIQKLVNEKFSLYEKKFFKATLDCRVFSTEEENWKNVFLWRILDCQKNAIQMMARTHYSNKELLNKNFLFF